MCWLVVYLPVAVSGSTITRMVILVDDGQLRTKTGFTNPLFSLTLYSDWLKDTVAAIT